MHFCRKFPIINPVHYSHKIIDDENVCMIKNIYNIQYIHTTSLPHFFRFLFYKSVRQMGVLFEVLLNTFNVHFLTSHIKLIHFNNSIFKLTYDFYIQG